MGITFLIPIIGTILMTVMIGSSIGPMVVEKMRIKKVENRTISNQNLIKD